MPKHAQEIFSGDLIVPQGFKWALESKGGYADLDLNSVFVAGSAELDGFLDQVTKDAERCGRKPMLCWKRDRKPWLAFVPATARPAALGLDKWQREEEEHKQETNIT